MPRDMFGDVVDPSVKLGSQKWYTVPLSVAAHVFVFAAVPVLLVIVSASASWVPARRGSRVDPLTALRAD